MFIHKPDPFLIQLYDQQRVLGVYQGHTYANMNSLLLIRHKYLNNKSVCQRQIKSKAAVFIKPFLPTRPGI
jgi:hypothetical protein